MAMRRRRKKVKAYSYSRVAHNYIKLFSMPGKIIILLIIIILILIFSLIFVNAVM